MKKHITLACLAALTLTVQAQQGGISNEMLKQIQSSYKNTSADKAIRNAIGGTDIRKLSLNQENQQGLDTDFSIKVESKGITDQQSSGRCWLFTGLNVMRAKAIADIIFLLWSFLRHIRFSGISWRSPICFCRE